MRLNQAAPAAIGHERKRVLIISGINLGERGPSDGGAPWLAGRRVPRAEPERIRSRFVPNTFMALSPPPPPPPRCIPTCIMRRESASNLSPPTPAYELCLHALFVHSGAHRVRIIQFTHIPWASPLPNTMHPAAHADRAHKVDTIYGSARYVTWFGAKHLFFIFIRSFCKEHEIYGARECDCFIYSTNTFILTEWKINSPWMSWD